MRCASSGSIPWKSEWQPQIHTMPAFAGGLRRPISELTAISQYVHHHVVLELNLKKSPTSWSVFPWWKCIIWKSGRDHLAAGVDPVTELSDKTTPEQYWNASLVYYGTSLCDRLTADIAGEWAAIANYRRYQQLINDPYIQNMLERIIMDELHHIRLFNQMVDKYCRPQL